MEKNKLLYPSKKKNKVSIFGNVNKLVLLLGLSTLLLFFILSYLSATWNSSLNTGLVAYYPMDNNTEFINGENNLTVLDGQIAFVTGLVNNCGQFLNNDTLYSQSMYLQNTTNSSVWDFHEKRLTNISINFWVNADYNSMGQYALINKRSSGSGWLIYKLGNYTHFDGLSYETLSIYDPDLLDSWVMYTIIRNSTNTSIWVNGVFKNQSSNELTGGWNSINTNVSLGAGQRVGQYNLNGSIDEIGIWNRTLSGSEILFLYNGGLATSPIVSDSLDSSYPTFSNINFNYSNGSVYSNENIYSINVSIENTNGTAGIEFNGTNYTTTNMSNTFTAILGKIGAGIYNYFWWAYGNGTSALFNISSVYSYTINKATPILNLLANGGTSNLTLIYPQQINISATSNQGLVGLDKDNIDYLTNNGLNVTLGVGEYIFRANISGNQNYSDVPYSYFNITINKAILSGSLNKSNASWTIEEGTQITINFTEANLGDADVVYKMFRDDIDKTGGENWTPSLGIYTYKLNSTGGQNYSENYSIDTQILIVQDTVEPIINITYPQNATYNINVSNLNYSIIETNPSKCWYSTNGGSTNSTSINAGVNFTNLTSLEGSNIWIVYCNDTSGNLDNKSVTFNKNMTPLIINLISPETATQDIDGTLDFIFIPYDANNISNCSLNYHGGIYTTLTSVNKNVQNDIQINNVDSSNQLYSNNLIWNITCTDILNNIANSESRNLDTIIDISTSSGSSSSGVNFIYLNPKYFNIYYLKDWKVGEDMQVKVDIFNYTGSKYIPKNITLKIIKGDLKIINYTSANNTFIANIKVLSGASAEVGIINVTVVDERTLSEQIQFKIERKNESNINVTKEYIGSFINSIYFIIAIIIVSLIAIVELAKYKRRR